MTIRKMTTEDIPKLRLEEKWMYDRYFDCFDSNIAYVMEDENGLLCAFGALFEWQGACEVWFNLIRKEKTITIIRTVRKILAEKAIEYKIRRMQAIVKKSCESNKKFMTALGFSIEGIMRKKLYNGEDAYLFARTF